MIEHVDTGRRYIGKSIDVEKRIREHFARGFATRSASPLHRAIVKYGRDAFRHSLIEVCESDRQAIACERLWIRAFGSKEPNGFNLTDGGEGPAGMKHSESTLAKMRASRSVVSQETRAKLRDAGTRRIFSAETRAKMSASAAGHKVSESTRAKLSAALRGNKSAKGHVVSAEARQKLSDAAKRQWSARKESTHG